MSTHIRLPKDVYEALTNHLLVGANEAAAFIFVKQMADGNLDYANLDLLSPADYQGETYYGVEFSEEVLNRLLSHATNTDTLLVEAHSHPFSERDVAFSSYDLSGLKEFVPHIWWRLRRGPYAALVFSQNDFDALIWKRSPDQPESLDGFMIVETGEIIRPTNRTSHSLIKETKHGRRAF